MKLPSDLTHVSGLLVDGKWLDTKSLRRVDGALAYAEGLTEGHFTHYVDESKVAGYRDNHGARARAQAEAVNAKVKAETEAQEAQAKADAAALEANRRRQAVDAPDAGTQDGHPGAVIGLQPDTKDVSIAPEAVGTTHDGHLGQDGHPARHSKHGHKADK